MGPVGGGKAHGAGLAGAVELTPGELEGAELRGGAADGGDLGVRGRIVGCGDEIYAGGDDLAGAHDYSAEGTTSSGGDVGGREINSLAHEGGIRRAR